MHDQNAWFKYLTVSHRQSRRGTMTSLVHGGEVAKAASGRPLTPHVAPDFR
jgi:hypothetical protein